MDVTSAIYTITLVHLLAAASPGPDFVLVAQQTLRHGRKAGIYCSIGIALGLSVHIAYTTAGLAVLLGQSSAYLIVIKLVAASYLIYLGVKGLRSQSLTLKGKTLAPSNLRKAVTYGFICNASNPKAPLYFLSVFTLVLSPKMPLSDILLIGGWLMFIQLAWFSSVALFLSTSSISTRFQQYGHWIDRIAGLVMALFGLHILLTIL